MHQPRSAPEGVPQRQQQRARQTTYAWQQPIRDAATEFALLTAAYGVTRIVIGTASGFLVESLGYGPYFWLTVFLGIPALALLPSLRQELSS